MRFLKIRNKISLVYMAQFFTFASIGSMLSLQFELLMDSRSVGLALALTILSVSQVLNMSIMFLIRKFDDKISNKNLIIKLSFAIRTVVVGFMFFVEIPILFIALFLLYQMAASPNILFEGLIAQWAYERGLDFGRLRLFASIGWSLGGLIAGFLFSAFGGINAILGYAFFVNIINTILAFLFPIRAEKTEKATLQKGMDKRYRLLLVLAASVMAPANTFSPILNSHYREVFGLSVDYAIFFAGLAMLIGVLFSEVIGFVITDKLMSKFGTLNILLAAMCISSARWIISIFAPNSIVFTATYLAHGIAFTFSYLGVIAYIKEKLGNEYTNKIVLEYVLSAFILGIILTQAANFILNFYSHIVLMGFFAVLSLSVLAIFWLFFQRKKVR